MILILLLASLVNCSGNSTHCPPSRPGEHFLGSGWWLEISPLITLHWWWQETLFWKIPPFPTFLDLERLLFFVRSGSKRSPHQGQQCLSTHNDVSPNVPLDLTLLYWPWISFQRKCVKKIFFWVFQLSMFKCMPRMPIIAPRDWKWSSWPPSANCLENIEPPPNIWWPVTRVQPPNIPQLNKIYCCLLKATEQKVFEASQKIN